MWRADTGGSSVGISATIQSTTKITTPDVDHGNNIAITTASRSTLRMRATGSCHAAKTIDAFAIHDVFLFSPAFTNASMPGTSIFNTGLVLLYHFLGD